MGPELLDRILHLPCLSGKVDPVPLLGGMTDENYWVADRGQKFVVRLGQDIPVHGVMRFGQVDAGLKRRLAAMKCASLLREAMWSMISEIHSTIPFDYAAYTADYLARFNRAYDEFAEGRD